MIGFAIGMQVWEGFVYILLKGHKRPVLSVDVSRLETKSV